jgi:hypothetical protein
VTASQMVVRLMVEYSCATKLRMPLMLFLGRIRNEHIIRTTEKNLRFFYLIAVRYDSFEDIVVPTILVHR